MSKLKLQIDNLKVESFETAEVRAGRGTVLGASILPATEAGPCPNDTEITGPCCDITLAISCVLTNCIAECNSFDAVICPG
ncbi:MAG TPA: pinensin family lanthipeptide [Longimicrobium sp.]|nr:pinensin family lanthipeptide [Longimicrobium sp.]